MFQATRAVFIYCVSPVHMGAGTAIGLIDNPIQRERHTDHPMVAGSGLKGAVRHHVSHDGWNSDVIKSVFGPETGASSDHAGAVSFSDAQIVAFPVRSLKRAFVYATSSVALARAARQISMAGKPTDWNFSDGACKVCDQNLLVNGKLLLETFEFSAEVDEKLKGVAHWLSENALPMGDGHKFFREKLKSDLILLPDQEFSYFVRNATVVEPHVRIDDTSGTADDGGLFYTENLPPESLLLSLIMASVEKKRKDNNRSSVKSAEQIINTVVDGDKESGASHGLDGNLIQIGGDATTGRGQVSLKFVGGKNNG